MNGVSWIPLLFVVAMVGITIGLGILTTRKAKSAADFFVAGRSVNVFWNASAISGEYLSAASFLGIAGLLMKNGYDVLWYPVCYATGYLFLLLFIAGPCAAQLASSVFPTYAFSEQALSGGRVEISILCSRFPTLVIDRVALQLSA